jgi:hypothetical protein
MKVKIDAVPNFPACFFLLVFCSDQSLSCHHPLFSHVSCFLQPLNIHGEQCTYEQSRRITATEKFDSERILTRFREIIGLDLGDDEEAGSEKREMEGQNRLEISAKGDSASKNY